MARAIHRYPLSTLCARLVKVSHGLRLTHGQLLDGRLASTAEDVFEHELPDVFYEYVLHGLEDKGRISTSYNQPTVSPTAMLLRACQARQLGSLRVKLHGMNGGHPSDIGNPTATGFFESLMVDEHPLF